jgi:hypothetical protein
LDILVGKTRDWLALDQVKRPWYRCSWGADDLVSKLIEFERMIAGEENSPRLLKNTQKRPSFEINVSSGSLALPIPPSRL